MAVSSEAVIIIDVELQGEDARKESDAIGVSIAKLRDVQKDLAKENKKTSTTYVENQQKIAALNREQKAYISIANASTGSNNQLRAQLSLLTAQYNALSKSERESTVAGKALQIQTRSISDEIKKNEQAVGDFRRDVGNYQKGLSSSLQTAGSGLATAGGIGFLPQVISAASGAINGFKAAVVTSTEAVKAQQIANEFLTISTDAQVAAEEAKNTALIASTNATEANSAAEQQAVIVQGFRIQADEQRIILENQLVASEEREAAVLAQLAAEQQAIVAEEQLRIANEQALVATQTELVAAEETRVALEAELTAATTAQAASEAAAAAATAARSSALKITGAGIVAIVLAVGAAALSFAKQMDGFGDSLEQDFERTKRGFREWGATIVDAVTGKGWAAFDGLKQRVRDATDAGAHFTEVFQNLGDLTDVNDLANQVTQNEVANLRLQARNRKLSNDQKQKLLDDADAMERNQFIKTQGLHATIIAENVAFAETSLRTTNKFTDEQRKALEAGDIQLANNLLNANKISKDAYKKLQEGYALRNSDLATANQNAEKIQNDKDKYDEKAKAAAEKRQSELDKINEDRIKSELVTVATLLTSRQKDVQDINADIDKRIKLYEKYGQDTQNLERERTARLLQLTQKYYDEDSKIIEIAYQKSIDLRIQIYTGGSDREEAVRKQKQIRELADIDAQILAVSSRVAKGEQDKNNILDALFAERKATTDQQNADDLQKAIDDGNAEYERRKAIQDKNTEDQKAAFEFELELADARKEVNNQLLGNYNDLFGGISELIGKNTVAGKIAFALQKSLAIAEIFINGEQERAAINLATARQIAAASALGPFGIPAIIAATALGAEKNAEITAREIISTGLIAAQAISGIITGKAKGGIQGYTSDGKGGVLKGYAKKDDTNAYLRSGEAVVVSEAAKNPSTRRLLSDINVAYGGNPYPGLALGGIYGGSSLQQTNSDITNQVFQQNVLNEAISRIKIYTAITDINAGQNNYAKIVDAANF